MPIYKHLITAFMTHSYRSSIAALVIVLIAGALMTRRSEPAPSPTITASTSTIQEIPQQEPVRPKNIEISNDPNKLEGFVVSLSTSTNGAQLVIDQIQTFGDENQEIIFGTATSVDGPRNTPGAADLAAIEDGSCAYKKEDLEADSCAPNGFYLRNNSTSTQTFFARPDADIYVFYPNYNDTPTPFQKMSLNTFVELYAGLQTNNFFAKEKGKVILTYPYHIQLKNGEIIRMEQQLVP